MVSYIKTQWWRLLLGVFCIIYSLHWVFQPAGAETVEGLGQDIGNIVSFFVWFINGLVWLIISCVDYNADCIRELEKRVTALEYRAVTDIDKVSDNSYIVRRRLGADKDEPYPEEV